MTTAKVPIAPPTMPSFVFPGLIHARRALRPAAEPMKYANTSLAITPTTTKNKVSVPTFPKPAPALDNLKISAP